MILMTMMWFGLANFAMSILNDASSIDGVTMMKSTTLTILGQRTSMTVDAIDVTRIVPFDMSALVGSYADANAEHCCSKEWCCHLTRVE